MSQIINALKSNAVRKREVGVAPTALIPSGVEHVRCQLTSTSRILTQDHDSRDALERFHLIDHRLRTIRQSKRLSTLLLTSSVPQEGKTMVSINLCSALAAGSRPVLLIDADMRRPGAGPVLGLDPRPGLIECLQGEGSLLKQILYLEDLNVYYLPAGISRGNIGELLQSDSMRTLLAEASAHFEWVLVDSPPLVPFADAHTLAALTDATLLVTRCGITTNESIKRSLASLEGVFIAGVVLNDCDDSRRGSYYSYYRQKNF